MKEHIFEYKAIDTQISILIYMSKQNNSEIVLKETSIETTVNDTTYVIVFPGEKIKEIRRKIKILGLTFRE